MKLFDGLKQQSDGDRRVGARAYRQFVGLQELEKRMLLSGVVSPWARLPNEASLSTPKFSNEWYYNNVGQTLTNATSGPSTGLAGADINATDAWDLTTGSNSVVVAVFDTGVDLNNPDLSANVWNNPGEIAGDGIDNDGNGFVDDVHGWNFVDGNSNVQDTLFHGTTTNGVLGAAGNNGVGIAGTAWNVKLLEVKIGDAGGVSDSNLMSAINYVNTLKQKGVNIVAINASYFSTGAMSLNDFTAIRSAGDNGILYVAAAGNSGLNLDFIPSGFLPSNMIFVAASDARDQLASFSDYGKNSVALAAPGVDITTPVIGGFTATLSGTSYSAPMVAGTLALMKSAVPGATMAQLKAALFAGADPVASLMGKVTYGRLDAYRSIELLLGQRAPVGNVDVFNATTITGWAFDANAGFKPMTVKLAVDGVITQTTTANVDRPDLTAVVGSSAHGFTFDISNLTGSHTIQVIAVDYDTVNPTLPSVYLKTGVINGASPPIGWLDVANATTVAGWAIDRDTPTTSVQVQVNVDGILAATGTADVNRPDLVAKYGSANHGFSLTIPTLTPTFHRIDVYAFDTTTNALTLIASRTVSGNVAATGFFDAFDGSTLIGWAVDPDTSSTSINIQYAIDGGAPVQVEAGNSRPALVSLFGSANHEFSVTLPQLAAGTHTAAVWAVDADTGALISLGSRKATVANPAGRVLPRGVIDIATTGTVQGWAFDATVGAGAIQVRVDVDGVAGTPFVANGNRPDLVPVLGSGNHGFSQALNLTPGEHTVAVYAIGSPSDEVVLLGTRLVGQAPSRGFFDVINSNMILGWAFNAGAGSGPVVVRLDVDGALGPITTANIDRPDLTAVVGSPLHGFAFATPALAAGSHRISLVVLDPVTAAPTIVANGTLIV